jgi:hypothetical protein
LGGNEGAIVVFEVFANAGEVVGCWDFEGGELRVGPDARDKEEFGGSKGARGEDYIFVCED